MTEPLDRLRQSALMLPEVEEGTADGQPAFLVAGAVFARLDGDTLFVRQAEGDAFDAVALVPDPDWPFVDDRLAAAWEYAAPRRLLEAGGR